MKRQIEELADQSKAETLKEFSEYPDTVSNQYLHDLYCFFKLNMRRQEFRDLLKETIRPYSNPALEDTLLNPDALLAPANFYFRKEYWEKAVEAYDKVIYTVPRENEIEVYQKQGYPLQKLKRYAQVIEAYRKADTLKPNNLWTNRHLAICYRLDRQFRKASEYYRKVEETLPEDTKVIFYIDNCLVETWSYEEVLNYFFKLDLLESNCIRAWRATGRCSSMTGEREQAMKYYDKVIAQRLMPVDYLNAGHVVWSLGDIEKAVSFYSEAAEPYSSKEQFLEMSRKDEDIITGKGITPDDIPLALDPI